MPRGVNADNWDRFQEHACLVQSLRWYKPLDSPGISLHEAIFTQIRRELPVQGSICPNLRQLEWEADDATALNQMLYFTGPSLKSLRINPLTHLLQARAFGKAFDGLCARSVSLQDFELAHWYLDDTNRCPKLASFITRQPALQSVRLPSFFGTRAVVTALSDCQTLEHVGLSSLYKPENDRGGIAWRFPLGKFGNLGSFGFSDHSLNHAAHVLLTSAHLNFTSITVATIDTLASNDGLALFVSSLATSCPRVRSLSLILFAFWTDLDEYDIPSRPLSFASFRPLLRCRELRSLHVQDNSPILISEQDVDDLSKAWPQLRSLDLATDPIEHDVLEGSPARFGNSLDILNAFARHGPLSLERIGLYFKFEGMADPLEAWDLSTLTSLRILSVGLSCVPDDEEERMKLVAYLGAVCSPSVLIEAGVSVHVKDEMGYDIGDDSAAEWREIQGYMQSVHASQRALRYQLELSLAKVRRIRAKI